MSQWPLGVFASIDARLGVHLEVAHEREYLRFRRAADSDENWPRLTCH